MVKKDNKCVVLRGQGVVLLAPRGYLYVPLNPTPSLLAVVSDPSVIIPSEPSQAEDLTALFNVVIILQRQKSQFKV